MEKKYSVLMSVYFKDNPDWLKYSLDSMLNQTIFPDEFVIVEDGPLTNELENVIQEYYKKHKKIFKIIKLEKNMGLGPALKIGVENCENEWIARMDSDDYSPEDRIAKQFRGIENHPELGIVGSNADEFSGEITNVLARVILPETNKEIVKFSKKRCPYRHSGIMYKKSEVLRAGRKELNGVKGYNIQEPLLYVRVNPKFYDRRGGTKYLKSILKFKKRLYKCGFFTTKEYIVTCSAHIVVCLMPNKLREFIYKKLLRK